MIGQTRTGTFLVVA